MPDGEHCILLHLEAPVDQSSGFDPKSLEAYKDALHRYVWEALDPLAVEGGFQVVHDRWVFEVDDPAGGSHPTDVILGGLDPRVFTRILGQWSAFPLQAALESASGVPDDVEGYRPEDIERLWAQETEVDHAFSEASMAARRAGFEAEDDLNTPPWAFDAHLAKKQAQGFYEFDTRFFSLAHSSSKLTRPQLLEVQEHPESYALVFVPVDAGKRWSRVGHRRVGTLA